MLESQTLEVLRMILCILQARFSSSRLPGKVLQPILGRPMLERQIERIKRANRINRTILATSTEKSDDAVAALATNKGIDCFRGSLNDVLDRFYQAARLLAPEHIVRLTGDCPLIDPAVINSTIEYYLEYGYDYVSNALSPTFPDGLDVEVFRFSALETTWREAEFSSHREHVTLFINQSPDRFRVGNYSHEGNNLAHLRWTVDESEDLEFVRRIYESLHPQNPAFSMLDVLSLLEKDPKLLNINSGFRRNEGLERSLEQDNKIA